jgi:hypothetical protein
MYNSGYPAKENQNDVDRDMDVTLVTCDKNGKWLKNIRLNTQKVVIA